MTGAFMRARCSHRSGSAIRSGFVGGGAADSTPAMFQGQSTSHFSRDGIQAEKKGPEWRRNAFVHRPH
jgi:hypothetical protein